MYAHTNDLAQGRENMHEGQSPNTGEHPDVICSSYEREMLDSMLMIYLPSIQDSIMASPAEVISRTGPQERLPRPTSAASGRLRICPPSFNYWEVINYDTYLICL